MCLQAVVSCPSVEPTWLSDSQHSGPNVTVCRLLLVPPSCPVLSSFPTAPYSVQPCCCGKCMLALHHVDVVPVLFFTATSSSSCGYSWSTVFPDSPIFLMLKVECFMLFLRALHVSQWSSLSGQMLTLGKASAGASKTLLLPLSSICCWAYLNAATILSYSFSVLAGGTVHVK